MGRGKQSVGGILMGHLFRYLRFQFCTLLGRVEVQAHTDAEGRRLGPMVWRCRVHGDWEPFR